MRGKPVSTDARPTSRRGRTKPISLAARLVALEDRVARLEHGLPPPGDGRQAAETPRQLRRCPGCGLPLRRSRGRCASCGRPLD